MKSLTLTASLFLAGAFAAGCNDVTLAVRVLAADGGDPFFAPDAATEARLRMEDNSISPVTSRVATNGYFALEASLAGSGGPTRAMVDALRMGEVVGGGATPPISWNALGPAVVSVFVQRRDSLVEYPWRLAYPRTSPQLFEVASAFLVALGGTSEAAPAESFNTLLFSPAANGSAFDSAFGRDGTFVRLADGRVLVISGCMALMWNPNSNAALAMPTSMPPPERCDLRGSSVVQDPSGGALLVGGRDARGPVARVDVVMPDGTWATALPMSVARVRPAVLRLGASEALIAGGQEPPGVFLERYTPTLAADRRPLRTGMSRVDERRGATLVEVGGGVALALGGSVLGSSDLTAEDVVLDTRCVDGSCPLVLGVSALLRERRRDAVAALAEGGRVVVASGAGAGGVASSVEIIDVSSARAPVGLGPIATLPYDGLTALRMSTGQVMFAGGATQSAWVYRH